MALSNLAKLVFWSILSFKNWSFANCSAFGASHFWVSFSHGRKSERIERKFKTQNPIHSQKTWSWKTEKVSSLWFSNCSYIWSRHSHWWLSCRIVCEAFWMLPLFKRLYIPGKVIIEKSRGEVSLLDQNTIENVS